MPTLAESFAVPTDERFSESGQGAALAVERRVAPRMPRRMIANVLAIGAETELAGLTEDISENGLFVQVPNAQALRVGQRCEVVLSDDPESDVRSPLSGERLYATVVRTQRLPNDSVCAVGAGLRFDHPLFL